MRTSIWYRISPPRLIWTLCHLFQTQKSLSVENCLRSGWKLNENEYCGRVRNDEFSLPFMWFYRRQILEAIHKEVFVMNNNVIKKLTSRKFIITVITAITGIIVMCIGESAAVQTIQAAQWPLFPQWYIALWRVSLVQKLQDHRRSNGWCRRKVGCNRADGTDDRTDGSCRRNTYEWWPWRGYGVIK